MAVIAWPEFSKLSLALTLMPTLVSSLVVTVSSAISETAEMLIVRLSVSVSDPSLLVMVSVAAPLKSATGV